MTKATISFVTQETDSSIKIALDNERNLDSQGGVKSSFLFGDTAYFRVYSDTPDGVFAVSTDGTVTSMGAFTEDVTDEIVTFITKNTTEPDKPVSSISSYTWLGKSLGAVTLDGAYSLRCADVPKPSEGQIASAAVSYRSVYRLFGLTLSKKNRDVYPVTVYAGVSNG